MCLLSDLHIQFFTHISQNLPVEACALLSGVRTVPLRVVVACPRACPLVPPAPLHRPFRLS